MAQAGLRIPAADGSRLPVFRSLFADIGDEQSIEASLSTFSAHITNIASMDRGLATPALVLLDEVGSGTDPIEGGALGVAIVDHFRRRGATRRSRRATTTRSRPTRRRPRAWRARRSASTPTRSRRPISWSTAAPGRSLALEIAGRLGLNPSVVAAARENLSAREAQLAEHLAKIDRDMRALEHEQRLAARERETLEAAEARMRQREDALRQREETFRRRLNEELETPGAPGAPGDRRRHRGAEGEDGRRSRKAPRLVSTGDTGAARSDARAAVDAIAGARERRRAEPSSHRPSARSRQPASHVAVGDRVIVGGLGLEAVGHRRCTTAPPSSTCAASACAPASAICASSAGQPRRGARQRQRRAAAARDDAGGSERDRLHRRRSDRRAPSGSSTSRCSTDQRVVRLIHGYGTGQLKRALAGFLQQHPLVARFATAPPEQGGGGVTVVELKD